MSQQINSFRVYHNNKVQYVPADRKDQARKMDVDKNGYISNKEVTDFLDRNESLNEHEGAQVNLKGLINSSKADLLGQKVDVSSGRLESSQFFYKTYEEMGAALDNLVEQYPGQAEKVSIGKSAEGRDIWALRVTDNIDNKNANKPGIVVTGCHHAREWATTEVPLHTATKVLEEFGSTEEGTKRLEQGELWFIPMVNPDGYEYSREERPMWRKNRRPIDETPCGPLRRTSYGVDLNRNYADGNPDHEYIYRPDNDKQCSTRDDGRATSDNPYSDTYRGPSGASEPEVQSVLNLELNRGNIKGVLDFHSYGGMILYPWGNERKAVENKDEYVRVGKLMNEKLDNDYRLMQSVGLYPTTGGSHDIHHANGIFSMTMEIGNQFHQPERDLPEIVGKNVEATTVFIDEVLEQA